MVTIVMRDALRAQVERASQGRQTVLYTAKGQPSYMSVVPLVTLAALGLAGAEGPHPAFIVGGRERGEFFYGSYGGVIRAGELVSLPGVAPGAWMDFAGASDAARACGSGWHLSTNAERAALMLWCRRHGHAAQGNTDSGRSILAPEARGQRVDGRDPGRAGRSGHADRQRSGALAARPRPMASRTCAATSGNGRPGCGWWTGKSRSFQTTTPCRPTCPRHPPTGGR